MIQRVKKIQDGDRNISVLADKELYNEKLYLIPTKNRVFEKLYDNSFSDAVHEGMMFLLCANIVFPLIGTVFSLSLTGDVFFGSSPLVFILIIVGVFAFIAFVEIMRAFAWNTFEGFRAFNEVDEKVELPISPFEIKYVMKVSEEDFLKLYEQTIKMRELKILLNKIYLNLHKEIEGFVRDDLEKRKQSLVNKFNESDDEREQAINSIKVSLEKFYENEREVIVKNNTKSVIKFLDELDDFEQKAG